MKTGLFAVGGVMSGYLAVCCLAAGLSVVVQTVNREKRTEKMGQKNGNSDRK